MSNARDGFDAIGVVVDWIDACKQRRLDDLLNLYDPWATVECCSGGRFKVDPRWNDTGSPGWLVRRLMHSRSTH
jgi:hypothetical protein